MYANLLRRLSARRDARPRRTKRHLTVEALEGRQLLSLGSQFQVDAGDLSLKYEVATAASANGSSIVVWVERPLIDNGHALGNEQIRAQYYNGARAKVGGEQVIAGKSGINEDEPSVAMDAYGDFVVSWTEHETSGDTNVYARVFTSSLVSVDGLVPVGIGTFREYESSVAMDAYGNFVVAYTRVTNGNNPDVFAKAYNSYGQLRAVITVAGTASAELNPSIAMDPAGDFDVAYQVGNGAYGNTVAVARYSRGFGLLGVVPISSVLGSDDLPSIAMDNQGDAVVVYRQWQDINGTANITGDAIYAERISASGVTLGPIFVGQYAPNYVVGVSREANGMGPSVAFELDGGFDGSFAVVYDAWAWYPYGQPSLEFAVVDGSNVAKVSFSLGDYTVPSISAAPFGFVMAYASPSASNLNNDIFGQRGSYF